MDLELLRTFLQVANTRHFGRTAEALHLTQAGVSARIEQLMVTSHEAITLNEALETDYVMVDWGLAHTLQHRRSFPDAPEPNIRLAQAKMALAFLLNAGGSAYLPVQIVAPHIGAGGLHVIDAAPTIERDAFAVYPIRSDREQLILSLLERF